MSKIRVTEGIVSLYTLLWFCQAVFPSVCHACSFENDRDQIIVCIFLKFGRHVHNDERMSPINFGGQRSLANVGERGDASLCSDIVDIFDLSAIEYNLTSISLTAALI